MTITGMINGGELLAAALGQAGVREDRTSHGGHLYAAAIDPGVVHPIATVPFYENLPL